MFKIVYISAVFLLFTAEKLTAESPSYPQRISIDTSKTLILSTIQISNDSINSLYEQFEYDLKNSSILDVNKYFYIAFRYRDKRLASGQRQLHLPGVLRHLKMLPKN